MIKDTFDYSTVEQESIPKQAGFGDAMKGLGNALSATADVAKKITIGATPFLLGGDLAARAYTAYSADSVKRDLYNKVDAAISANPHISETMKPRAREVMRYYAETMPSEMQTNYGFNSILQSAANMDFMLPPEAQKNIMDTSSTLYPKKSFFDGDTLSDIHSMFLLGHGVSDVGGGIYDFVQTHLADKRGDKMISDLSQSIPERDRQKWVDAAEYVISKNPLLLDKPITFKDTVDAVILDNGVGSMRDINTLSYIGAKNTTNPLNQMAQRNAFQSTMNHLNAAKERVSSFGKQPDYGKFFGSPSADAAQQLAQEEKNRAKQEAEAVKEQRRRDAQANTRREINEGLNNYQTLASDLQTNPAINAADFVRHSNPNIADLARNITKEYSRMNTDMSMTRNNPELTRTQLGAAVARARTISDWNNTLADLINPDEMKSSSILATQLAAVPQQASVNDQIKSLFAEEMDSCESNPEAAKNLDVARFTTYMPKQAGFSLLPMNKFAGFGTTPTTPDIAQIMDGMSTLMENMVDTDLLEKALGSLQLISVAENAR